MMSLQGISRARITLNPEKRQLASSWLSISLKLLAKTAIKVGIQTI